jgi:hypothetical protein
VGLRVTPLVPSSASSSASSASSSSASASSSMMSMVTSSVMGTELMTRAAHPPPGPTARDSMG